MLAKCVPQILRCAQDLLWTDRESPVTVARFSTPVQCGIVVYADTLDVELIEDCYG
jgi:hypothetical protein